jgi:hypothetical protein
MSSPGTLLTTPDVAKLLGKSARTVHRAVIDHKLRPAMQVGTGPNAPYLFDPDEVARFLAVERRTHARHEKAVA